MESNSNAPTATPATRSSESVLVEPEWLAAHLYDPDVRVIEVDVSSSSYDDWHIDGAVLWNIYRDTQGPRLPTGRHSQPGGSSDALGIAPHSTVVFYGYAPALGFWLLSCSGMATAGSWTVDETPGGLRVTPGP